MCRCGEGTKALARRPVSGIHTAPSGAIDSGTDPLLIGSNQQTAGYYFDGAVDDVRMYSRALIQSEVASLYQGWESYTYDGDGVRVMKDVGGERTVYPNKYYQKNTTTGEVTKHYFHGGQMVALSKAGTLEYVHQDHLNSTSLTTNSTGAVVSNQKFLPFGGARSATGTPGTDRAFTGQRLDGTGLYFYNARYYDAAVGRFISPDILVADPANPQAFNRFSYVFNNPTKFTDPSGYCINNDGEQTRGDYFDCTVDEFADLNWDIRIQWIDILEEEAGTPGWFGAIQGFIEFLRDNPGTRDMDGWFSYSDASVLFAIQSGYRFAFENGAGVSEYNYYMDKAGVLWGEFFSGFNSRTEGENKGYWAQAEQAGVDAGVFGADIVVGRPGGFDGMLISNILAAGDFYRDGLVTWAPWLSPKDRGSARALANQIHALTLRQCSQNFWCLLQSMFS